MSSAADGVRGSNRAPRRRRSSVGRSRAPLAFVVPLAVFLGAFVGYPMVQLIRMSFSEVKPATILREWPFVGGQNYAALFADPTFWPTVGRTAVFGGVVLAVGLIGGLAAALALAKKTRLNAIAYATMVLCWVLPSVVNGAVWKYMLTAGGTVDQMLMMVGLTQDSLYLLVDGWLPLLSVAFVAGWATLPFAVIVFRSALLEVPRDYYEAAEMDGASRMERFRHVTLPQISPTVWVVSILLLSYAVRSFDFTFTMTSGGPGQASTTLPYRGYLDAFAGFNYSAGAAVAVITVVAVLMFALPYARAARKQDHR